MYKKRVQWFVGIQVVLLVACVCVIWIHKVNLFAVQIGNLCMGRGIVYSQTYISTNLLSEKEAKLPVLLLEQVEMVENERVTYTQEDYENLLRIVEAEARGEDLEGKRLVANVVLNRVNSGKFPNTISEVIFQKNEKTVQFSPTVKKNFQEIEISEETYQAVEEALNGEDTSEGALFFAARKYANEENMRWFDTHLERLFTHGGHEFFK